MSDSIDGVCVHGYSRFYLINVVTSATGQQYCIQSRIIYMNHAFFQIFWIFFYFFLLQILMQFYQTCEEPMTKVTGFQQSVRLFQSYDPVTPSILSSFLLHLSDALPSGRVLLRLSVRHPYADSPTAVQALKVDSHHGSHASPRYRCFVIWLFPFPECLSICDRFYTLLG